jgi:hypothetical protein
MKKSRAYGFPQMSDGWIKGVVNILLKKGLEMGQKLKTAIDSNTLEKSVTVTNEWGEHFIYKPVNGQWTLQ